MKHSLTSVLDWLRKGYPEGIPPKDFPPLLALLQRSLTPQEVQQVVAQVIADNPDGDIARESVAHAIENVKNAPPNQDDINDVAARLAAVGWPLLIPAEETRASTMSRVLGWLRTGYPDGVPPIDRLPVLALLRPRLSNQEVADIARTLIHDHATTSATEPITEADAQELIAQIIRDAPSSTDIDRVGAWLAGKGWPLANDRA